MTEQVFMADQCPDVGNVYVHELVHLPPPPTAPADAFEAWLLQQQMILDAQVAEDAQVAADAQFAAELQDILNEDEEQHPEDDDHDDAPFEQEPAQENVSQYQLQPAQIIQDQDLTQADIEVAFFEYSQNPQAQMYMLRIVFVFGASLLCYYYTETVLSVLVCVSNFILIVTVVTTFVSLVITLLERLTTAVIAFISRILPYHRQRLWTNTQSTERIERLGEHYMNNRNLIDQTECPVCLEVCDRSTIFFPCFHHMCVDCSSHPQFQGLTPECPVCRAMIEDRVEVEGRPFTAPFRVCGQMREWVINWGSGEEVPAAN